MPSNKATSNPENILTGQCVKVVPGEGFEPPSFGLQNRCTTTVLTRPRLDGASYQSLPIAAKFDPRYTPPRAPIARANLIGLMCPPQELVSARLPANADRAPVKIERSDIFSIREDFVCGVAYMTRV
jgi:hypothetical protein